MNNGNFFIDLIILTIVSLSLLLLISRGQGSEIERRYRRFLTYFLSWPGISELTYTVKVLLIVFTPLLAIVTILNFLYAISLGLLPWYGSAAVIITGIMAALFISNEAVGIARHVTSKDSSKAGKKQKKSPASCEMDSFHAELMEIEHIIDKENIKKGCI